MEDGILRVNKVKLNGISKAFHQHHQREASFYKSHPDIDISKIGEDVSLIHSNNFKKDIQMQLAMYHITKTPRNCHPKNYYGSPTYSELLDHHS